MDRPALSLLVQKCDRIYGNTRPGISTNNQRHKLYPNHDAAVMAGWPLFALLSSDFLFFSFLHLCPQIQADHHNKLPIAQINDSKVPVQPLPILFNSGSTRATPPAPSKHRIKLFAAVAADGLSG